LAAGKGGFRRSRLGDEKFRARTPTTKTTIAMIGSITAMMSKTLSVLIGKA
jgi:hypothetical protein